VCVLVAVLLTVAGAVEAQAIRVAVEDGSGGGGGAATVAQLNDDSYFDFGAVLVGTADLDTALELAAYDVVILGGSGYNDADWTPAMTAALRAWVEAGNGAILTGWGNYDVNAGEPITADIEALFPGQNIPSVNEFVDGSQAIDILVPGHPITQGLANFATGAAFTEVNRFAAEADDTVLAAIVGAPADLAVAVKENVGAGGRTVYLGPIYLANTGNYSQGSLRSGSSDQLLEQAVAWAAGAEGQEMAAIPALSGLGALALAVLIAAAGLAALKLRA
jgi:hypothetical protein